MLGMSVKEQARQAVKQWLETSLDDKETLIDTLICAFRKDIEDHRFTLFLRDDDPTVSWCHRNAARYIEENEREMVRVLERAADEALPDRLNLN